MRWLATRTVPIKRLKVSGEFAKKRRSQVAKEIAGTLAETAGFVQLPVISSANEIVVGEHRIAAALESGAKSVEVRVVDADAREIRRLRAIENLFRRHMTGEERDRELAAFVADVEADISGQTDQQLRSALPVNSTGNPGRPKSARGQAIEKVAAAVGSTPEAVRSAVKRAEANDSAPTSQPSVQTAPPPIETWGLAAPEAMVPEELAEVAKVQAVVDSIDRLLRKAQTEAAALRGGSPLGSHTYAEIYSYIHRAADEVRRSRPHAICPYCKRVPQVRAQCMACHGLGVVPECECENIEPALLRRTKHMVAPGGGGLVPIEVARTMKLGGAPTTAAPSQPVGKPREIIKGGLRRNVIEMPDGTIYEPGDGPEVPAEYQADALPSDEEIPV